MQQGQRFFIYPKHTSGKCIDISGASNDNGAQAILYSYHGRKNQQFFYDNGVIRCVHSNKVLDVYQVKFENGTSVKQWDYHGGANQLWDIDGDQIKVRGKNFVLSVAGASVNDNAQIQIWSNDGAQNQRWTFVPVIPQQYNEPLNDLPATNDRATLLYHIANNRSLVSNWANLANSLGYGWCGGTGIQWVGEDFTVSKTSDSSPSFTINANYREDDPYKDGYRANERLKMKIANFRQLIDMDTMQYSKPLSSSLDPIAVGQTYAENYGDTKATVAVTFSAQLTSSVSHSTNYSFTEGFDLKQKWTAGIPGLGSTETEFTFKFSATQGWTDTTTDGETKTITQTVNCDVPPKSRVPVSLYAVRTKNVVTYSAKATFLYSMQLVNFLAWSWNAKIGFPRDRPRTDFTFGDSTNTSAIENLWDLYSHRSISGYNTTWDWNAATSHNGGLDGLINNMKNYEAATTVTGKFTNVFGTSVTYKIGSAEPLPSTTFNSLRLMTASPLSEGTGTQTAHSHDFAVTGVHITNIHQQTVYS